MPNRALGSDDAADDEDEDEDAVPAATEPVEVEFGADEAISLLHGEGLQN